MRTQLASYSPLSLGGMTRAAARLLGGDSAHASLSAELESMYDPLEIYLPTSGTQALQIGLAAASTATGGAPVALPAYTCFDIVSAAVGAEVPVVFYDIDPDSLTPDLASLERALDCGARTVVAAYLYGFPIDWSTLRSLADDFGSIVVEDAAQGGGTTWGGRPAGTLGDLAVLSFGRGKGWTGGGGGALLVHSDRLTNTTRALAAALPRPGPGRELRTAAVTWVQWLLGRPSLYGLPRSVPALGLGRTVYHPPTTPVLMPRSAALTAVAHAELARAEVMARRRWASWWTDRLADAAGPRACAPVSGGESGWLRYPIRIPVHADRDRLLDRLVRVGGASGYPVALPDLPEIREHVTAETGPMPGARLLASNTITVPTHSFVRERDAVSALDAITRTTPAPTTS